jgi:hypothetical protein
LEGQSPIAFDSIFHINVSKVQEKWTSKAGCFEHFSANLLYVGMEVHHYYHDEGDGLSLGVIIIKS